MNNINYFGLFSHGESRINDNFLLASFGVDDKQINKEYKKEICEVAIFLLAIIDLGFSWGVTNYYRQDINYQNHINFLETCLSVAKEKKEVYEEEED